MTRILVTGAAGFIGSHLVDRLLAEGHTVLGLDNFDPFYDPAIKRANLAQALGQEQFELVEADIRQGEALQRVFEKFRPDKVVHLAALAGVRPSLERPHAYYDVNVQGTLQVLEAMVQCGCRRLIYGSTSSVYGAASHPPYKESQVADRPCSPYAASKRAAEILAYTWHHLHGLEVTCLRFFTVFGPRQRPEMAIHKFARHMLDGRSFTMFGDGSSSRDYTYIDDILDGIGKAIDHEEGYGIYNLGESQTTTLKELIGLLEEALGVSAILESLPDQPGDVPSTCADISHSRQVLGYAPGIPVREGLQRFVRWLREQRS